MKVGIIKKPKNIDRLSDLLYLFTKEQLKSIARKVNVPVRGDKCDILCNIMGTVEKHNKKFDNAIITIIIDI